jgi:hypothetical protein
VTSIVGNILISFALNIQRYAHIRLHRDKLRRNRSWAASLASTKRKSNNGVAGYYGTPADPADGSADANRRGPAVEGEEGQEEEGIGGMVSRNRYRGLGEGAEGKALVTDREESEAATIRAGEEEASKSYLRSPYWWVGILLMTVGEAGNFLAYGFAPASIVSPLGVVALVSNCIIAPCLLKERFRQRDFWGVVIAVGGAVTVVLSAKNSETKIGPDDVWSAITQWEFELYLGITGGAVIALMWASEKYGDRSIFIDLGLVGLFGRWMWSCYGAG